MSDPSPVAVPLGSAEPFIGFAATARAAVTHLNRQLPGMQLWMVSSVLGDRQLVVASAGEWADRVPAGSEFSWHSSLCLRMVTGTAPAVALDIGLEPSYQSACVGPLASVRAYLGIPLVLEDGSLFGTLCAVATSPLSARWHETMPTVSFMGRMLVTVLSGQRAARDRSVEAAHAYASIDRDPLTGLRNRRGFEQAVRTEDGRGQRFGTRSSIVTLALGPLPPDADEGRVVRRCAEVLATFCAPGDVGARTGRNEFAMVVAETDAVTVRALRDRLRQSLRAAGIPASVCVGTGRETEDLATTWARAENAARDTDLRRDLVQ